jgi:DNA-binding NarL/FixJ family response regulator
MHVRLVLAEDNLLVREGLQQLLSGADGMEVVGSCVSASIPSPRTS